MITPPADDTDARVAWRLRDKSLRVLAPAVTLAMTLLLGCAVGPNYRRPAVETPSDFKEAGSWKLAEPRESQPQEAWWRIYDDKDLDGLMRQVELSNQNVTLYLARYDQAAALVGQARASYFPSLTAEVSTVRSQSALAGLSRAVVPATSAGAPAKTQTVDRVALSTSWELDVWGRIRRMVESNRASAQASAADLAAALLSAQGMLAQTYFQLRVTDLELRLLETSMEAYRKALEVTQNRYEAGVAQRSDVTQAQTQLESARAEWLDLGITRATLEHAIAVLVGRPPAALDIKRTDQVPVVPEVPRSLPSALLERRPDVAAAERRVAAANAEIGVAQAAYFPSLTLTGDLGYAHTGWANLVSLPNRFWSIGPLLAQTLFDAGARRYRTAEATALYDQSVASYRQTVLTAFQNVEDDLVTLRVLKEEMLAERAAADAAEQTLEIVQNRYTAGTVTYLEVVSAQTASLNAERAYRDILRRSLVVSAALVTALGGGWSADALPP